jgi:hypothetical protein
LPVYESWESGKKSLTAGSSFLHKNHECDIFLLQKMPTIAFLVLIFETLFLLFQADTPKSVNDVGVFFDKISQTSSFALQKESCHQQFHTYQIS